MILPSPTERREEPPARGEKMPREWSWEWWRMGLGSAPVFLSPARVLKLWLNSSSNLLKSWEVPVGCEMLPFGALSYL